MTKATGTNPTVNIEKTVALREAEMATGTDHLDMEDRNTAPKGTDRLVSTGPYTLPENPVPQATKFDPTWTHAMTADQQIRAKALECAVRTKPSIGEWHIKDIMRVVSEFERYIKEGK